MKRAIVLLTALATVFALVLPAVAQEERPELPLPERIADAKLSQAVTIDGPAAVSKLDPSLLRSDGETSVIVRRQSEGQTREFDARPSIANLEVRDEAGRPVLETHVRFTARAQVRPDEIVALLLPRADARTADVERTQLWAEIGGRRLDPLELLGARP